MQIYFFLVEEWADFKEDEFRTMKEKNNRILGNYHPKIKKQMTLKSSMDYEGEEENDESKGGEIKVSFSFIIFFH